VELAASGRPFCVRAASKRQWPIPPSA
jgi:hypothetical protein